MDDYTQLGAAPGTAMMSTETPVPGDRDNVPGGPLQASADFASNEEERAFQPQLVGALEQDAPFDPDGSPRTEEAILYDELQRVQRDIANRRLERKRRLEQQIALARQQLQAEEESEQAELRASMPSEIMKPLPLWSPDNIQ